MNVVLIGGKPCRRRSAFIGTESGKWGSIGQQVDGADAALNVQVNAYALLGASRAEEVDMRAMSGRGRADALPRPPESLEMERMKETLPRRRSDVQSMVARMPKWKSCLTSGAGTLRGGGYSWSFLRPVPEGTEAAYAPETGGRSCPEFIRRTKNINGGSGILH